MPSVFTHIAVPLAIGLGLGRKKIPVPLLAAGMLATVIADADVLAFRLGVDYASEFGHRGFTHSIVFAILLGLIAAGLAGKWQLGKLPAFLFVTLCALSHPLLDAMSNGGLGVALFWPFDDTRHFFAYRPIEVAHIGLRFFKEDTFITLKSELIHVWVPAVVLCGLLFVFNRDGRKSP